MSFACNDSSSEHWFLGVVLCKQRIVLALDSLPGLPVKPTVLPAVEKIESFLQCIGYSVDIKQRFFSSNKPGEIP